MTLLCARCAASGHVVHATVLRTSAALKIICPWHGVLLRYFAAQPEMPAELPSEGPPEAPGRANLDPPVPDDLEAASEAANLDPLPDVRRAADDP